MDKKSKGNFLDKLSRTFDLIRSIGTSIASIEQKVDSNTGRLDSFAQAAEATHLFGELTLPLSAADVVYSPGSADHATIGALCRAIEQGRTAIGTIIIAGVRYSVVNAAADTTGYKLYLSWIEPTASNTRLRTAKVVFLLSNDGTITLRPTVVRQIDMATNADIKLNLAELAANKDTIEKLSTAQTGYVKRVTAQADATRLKMYFYDGAGNVVGAATKIPSADRVEAIATDIADVKPTVNLNASDIAAIRRYICESTGDDPVLMDDYAYQIQRQWDPECTSMANMYQDDESISYFPMVDTSNVTSMRQAFAGSTVKQIANIDTSNVTDMYCMFDASDLEEWPAIDTSNATNVTGILYGCKIKKIDKLDFPKARSFGWQGIMAGDAITEEIGEVDLSGCTNAYNLFIGCTKLRSIGKLILNCPETFTARQALHSCTALTKLPTGPDWTLCSSLSSTFKLCKSLTAEEIVTSDVLTIMDRVFEECSNLEYIDGVFVGTNVTRYEYAFSYSRKLKRVHFRNFGAYVSPNVTGMFRGVTLLGADSEENRRSLVDSLLTDSYDRAASGYSALTVQLEPAVLARLTDAEKAGIAAKGFTLASY